MLDGFVVAPAYLVARDREHSVSWASPELRDWVIACDRLAAPAPAPVSHVLAWTAAASSFGIVVALVCWWYVAGPFDLAVNLLFVVVVPVFVIVLLMAAHSWRGQSAASGLFAWGCCAPLLAECLWMVYLGLRYFNPAGVFVLVPGAAGLVVLVRALLSLSEGTESQG